MKFKSYFVREGEWREKKRRGNLEGCCDCGLVHRVDYTVLQGKVLKRTSLAPRITKAARKKMGVDFRREQVSR